MKIDVSDKKTCYIANMISENWRYQLKDLE